MLSSIAPSCVARACTRILYVQASQLASNGGPQNQTDAVPNERPVEPSPEDCCQVLPNQLEQPSFQDSILLSFIKACYLLVSICAAGDVCQACIQHAAFVNRLHVHAGVGSGHQRFPRCAEDAAGQYSSVFVGVGFL